MAKKTTAKKKVEEKEERIVIEMTEEDEIPTMELEIGNIKWVLLCCLLLKAHL